MSPRLPGLPTRLDPDEDARLVALCLSGDSQAWELLVHRHERLVYAVARSYRLDESDLGDVFQEVFSALVKGLPRIRETRALCRWLSSTTERIARATALRRRREDALTASPEAMPLEDLTDGGPSASADLERLEEQALVRLALSALPPRCRTLLTALYYEDPPPAYTALSERLGVPIGSLGPTRARCFDRLRTILEADRARDGISAPTESTSPGTDHAPGGRPRREHARVSDDSPVPPGNATPRGGRKS